MDEATRTTWRRTAERPTLYILSTPLNPGDFGVPIAVDNPMEWGKWWARNPGRKRVCESWLDDGKTHVSTVFLKIDHQWQDEGPPILLETMVFTRDDRLSDFSGWQVRYPTLPEAIVGHAQVVSMLRAWSAHVDKQRMARRAVFVETPEATLCE